MLSGETNVPRSVAFKDADRCAQAIVDRVGYDLRLAVPVSIGKPILIVVALYRLAEADRRVQLTIFTGLTLTLPRPRSSLEASVRRAASQTASSQAASSRSMRRPSVKAGCLRTSG